MSGRELSKFQKHRKYRKKVESLAKLQIIWKTILLNFKNPKKNRERVLSLPNNANSHLSRVLSEKK